MQDCRRHTLALVKDISPDVFCRQSHPDFSPVGWHLGHIAYTESLWILEYLAGQQPAFGHYRQLFDADGLPKAQRQRLPEIGEILTYLDEVRSHTLFYLQNNKPHTTKTEQLWHWLIQHESQHAETIAMVLAMHQLRLGSQPSPPKTHPLPSLESDRVLITAGEITQGYNGPEAIDNERPAHAVSLDRYWIDSLPVSCGQYREFIAAGGYEKAEWWCEEGWRWQQSAGVKAPLYWRSEATFDQHPVCGVSWYEADAYARFVGKRLPTETEWEAAARPSTRCKQMIGNVWEWTDSWFAAYPNFQSFPYAGYSQIYFDGAHRVLRGGSWASPAAIKRRQFRNWYAPHTRALFAGFRCAA
ncbi:MAG: DinB family protein [Cyanobacteria bacterium J06598_1]